MKKLLLILLCPILLLTSCSKPSVTPEIESNIEETIVGKTWKLLNSESGWFHLNDNNTYLTKDNLCDSLEQFGAWELDGSVLIMTHIIGSAEYVERNTIIAYNDSIFKVQANTSNTLDVNIIFEVTEEVIRGCMNTTFLNFNPYAECPDTCINASVYGCMDALANNYNPAANIDDGYCIRIGDTFQGGIIFWGDGNGGGLIAAPSDQSTAEWGCYGTLISGADGKAIGRGNQNTIDILNGCTTPVIAAYICDTLTLGGYSDWFLPSKDELNEMYSNLCLQSLGGFVYGAYWSSTEGSNAVAWYQNFANGLQNGSGKFNGSGVRAVRAF